jgi:hypothetical protein
MARDEREVRTLVGRNACAIVALPISTVYEVGESARASTPSESERFACASMSTTTTRRPWIARAAPRFAVVVVFPTPPF